MRTSMGRILLTFLAIALLFLEGRELKAAESGSKPYSIIVAFSAGGPADGAARAFQPGMTKALDNVVIVENFPGAGGSIGVGRLLSRDPDGHSVLMATVAEPILPPLVMEGVSYRSEDLRLVSTVLDSYLGIIAGPDAPFSSTQELIEWAKQNPEHELSYATPGVGTLFHLMGEHFKQLSGVNLMHVPYRGVAPGVNDVIGGVIDLAFVPLAGNIVGMINTDRIKLIGTTSTDPIPVLKTSSSIRDVPGFEGFDYMAWLGVFVNRDVGPQALEKIHAAVAKTIPTPAFREYVLGLGDVPREGAQSLDEAQAFYESEIEKLRVIAEKLELEKI